MLAGACSARIVRSSDRVILFLRAHSFLFASFAFASSSSDLHAQIGLQDLQKSVDQFGADHPHTCLCPRLKGMSVRGGNKQRQSSGISSFSIIA